MINTIDDFRGKYFFLSNFYSHPVTWEGIIYPTNEHAFQAAKTLNSKERQRIALATTPGYAKSMGRKVKLRSDWEQVKYNIMRQIVFAKFNSNLGDRLLATGDAYLEEKNWWGDKIWGVCDGEGKNWLGEILMSVRAELKAERS